jgi:hypothetical protein
MGVAEKGRRSGWERQANGLVASHAALGMSAKSPTKTATKTATKSDTKSATEAAVDRGGTLLDRRKALRLVRDAGADPIARSIETGLARELDQACAEIARQKRQPSASAAASGPRRPAVATAGAAKPAEKVSNQLQTEAGAEAPQKRADRLAAENAHLSQKLAERERALADAHARIKSLEQKLSAAGEGAAKSSERSSEKSSEKPSDKPSESQQNELRAARDRLQKKHETATTENARLARVATERDRVLADARTRVEYLEAALAAAEAECGRLKGEAAGAHEKHRAETSRAITAEKLLAEARERLLARIIEIDAVRQRVAQANAASGAAYDRQYQLEDALCLQHKRFEELERSQSKLAEATKVLLQRFRDRERALLVTDEKIKALAERNACLEAARDRAGTPDQRGRETPQSRLEEAADATLADWAELARLLGNFVERKTATTPATRRSRSVA